MYYSYYYHFYGVVGTIISAFLCGWCGGGWPGVGIVHHDGGQLVCGMPVHRESYIEDVRVGAGEEVPCGL